MSEMTHLINLINTRATVMMCFRQGMAGFEVSSHASVLTPYEVRFASKLGCPAAGRPATEAKGSRGATERQAGGKSKPETAAQAAATPTKYASSDVQHAGDECEDYGGGEDVKFTGEQRARRLRGMRMGAE